MIVIGLFALFAAATTPPAIDPRGKDLIDLFESMCVEGAGGSAALHRLDSMPPEMGRRIGDDELHRMEPLASEGWILRSPAGGWAALYDVPAQHSCVMKIREAQPGGLKDALATAMTAFYTRMGATVSQGRPDETHVVQGVTVHDSSWKIDLAGHQMAVIATFGDRPMGAMQHLLTFTLLH